MTNAFDADQCVLGQDGWNVGVDDFWLVKRDTNKTVDQKACNVLCDKVSPSNPFILAYKDIAKQMFNHYEPESLKILESCKCYVLKQEEGEFIENVY